MIYRRTPIRSFHLNARRAIHGRISWRSAFPRGGVYFSSFLSFLQEYRDRSEARPNEQESIFEEKHLAGLKSGEGVVGRSWGTVVKTAGGKIDLEFFCIRYWWKKKTQKEIEIEPWCGREIFRHLYTMRNPRKVYEEEYNLQPGAEIARVWVCHTRNGVTWKKAIYVQSLGKWT